MSLSFAEDPIRLRIHFVRGHPVLLEPDLAELYGVSPNRLGTQAQQFPGEFCFALEKFEIARVYDDTFEAPQHLQAFTEHGALLMAYLIGTPEAVAMGIRVARTFIRLRQKSRQPAALATDGYWFAAPSDVRS